MVDKSLMLNFMDCNLLMYNKCGLVTGQIALGLAYNGNSVQIEVGSGG